MFEKEFTEFLHLQTDEWVEEYNKKFDIKVKKSQEELEDLLDKIVDTMNDVAVEGGSYTDDAIKVTVKVEYIEEDK